MAESFEAVLDFWFPTRLDQSIDVVQMEWWFRGGADAEILARFRPLLERAERGECDDWARAPESRLALILVLDQFPRTIHRGTARAFAQGAKAVALVREGIELGHYTALGSPWKKTFFFLPLGHAEDLAAQDEAVELAEALAIGAAPEHRELLAFSASQARASREVIARFGRHPHRNEALGRESTPEERAYLAAGNFVHTRRPPGR